MLERWIPLPLIEVSHLLGSLIGVALLLLARALQQRLDAAYFLSLAGLAAGAVASITKGLDYEEAALLSRSPWSRCSRAIASSTGAARCSRESFSAEWIVGIALVVVGTAVVTLFAYRHVEYSRDLWWSFDVHGHAPRSLRALFGAGFCAGALRAVSLDAAGAARRGVAVGRRTRASAAAGRRRRRTPRRISPCSATRRLLRARRRRGLRDVRHRGAFLDRDGRSGGRARRAPRARLALPRAGRRPRRSRVVLRGLRQRPARLSRSRPHAAQARRGGARGAGRLHGRRRRSPLETANGAQPHDARRLSLRSAARRSPCRRCSTNSPRSRTPGSPTRTPARSASRSASSTAPTSRARRSR